MCGNYSREETIQQRKLFAEIRYLSGKPKKLLVKTNLTVKPWKQANERMTPTKRHNATVITRQLPLECNVLTRDFNSILNNIFAKNAKGAH